MQNIVPFDSANVPAAIATIFGDARTNDIVGNSSGSGFPVISIKGKVFHCVRGGERTLITKPGEEDPAASLEVVVIKVNPNKSKVFYTNGYQEGENGKPTCYSNSGIAPEVDAAEPQAKKCATCAHNQWGSRITDNGSKGKSCADVRRMAIATVDTPSDPMLLRVPAGSMKAFEEYGKILVTRNIRPEAVITRIGFDYSVAHPALTFRPVAFVGDAETLMEIKAASSSELAAQIVGMSAAPISEAESNAEHGATVEPVVAAPSVAAKPAVKPAAPKPAVKPAAPEGATTQVDKAMAAASATKKVNVVVETPAPVAAQDTTNLESQIDSMIDSMEFDD